MIGAWIGGFTYSPIWTTLFFAVGAGAIVQVVYELWRLFARRSPGGLLAPLNAAGVLARDADHVRDGPAGDGVGGWSKRAWYPESVNSEKCKGGW